MKYLLNVETSQVVEIDAPNEEEAIAAIRREYYDTYPVRIQVIKELELVDGVAAVQGSAATDAQTDDNEIERDTNHDETV